MPVRCLRGVCRRSSRARPRKLSALRVDEGNDRESREEGKIYEILHGLRRRPRGLTSSRTIKKGSAMKRKSKLTIAIATAVLAALGSTDVRQAFSPTNDTNKASAD